MAKVAHAKTVGIHTPNELANYISDRATALGISDSKYILAILEKWRTDGAAPISALDDHAQKLWAKMSADGTHADKVRFKED